MASTSGGRDDETGDVEFILGEDGRVTAHDTETGIASYGESKAEALRMLAEALELHDEGGESVSEDDLREFGLDPSERGDEEPPEFMQ